MPSFSGSQGLPLIISIREIQPTAIGRFFGAAQPDIRSSSARDSFIDYLGSSAGAVAGFGVKRETTLVTEEAATTLPRVFQLNCPALVTCAAPATAPPIAACRIACPNIFQFILFLSVGFLPQRNLLFAPIL
jgi:hypothetical protein